MGNNHNKDKEETKKDSRTNKNIYRYYILFIGNSDIGIKSLFNKIMIKN